MQKYPESELEKMRDWLEQGEIDIRLMERMGLVTCDQIIEICHSLTDSPWHNNDYVGLPGH